METEDVGAGAGQVDRVELPPEVVAAANGSPLDKTGADAALAWLMSDDPEESVLTKDLRINIAGGSGERFIDWRIKSVDRDLLRSIQKAATGGRAQRRAGAEADVGEANLRIVACATVKPDLVAAAEQRGIPAAPDPLHAPMQLLAWRFRDRPGLIDQVAGQVLNLSGYDEDDVQVATLVTAAGN